MPSEIPTTAAGPIPTPEQREVWGDDYLWMWCSGHPKEAAQEIGRLRAEIADLKTSVIAFGAPWMVEYARMWCMPSGHLDPTHYDILKRAGARMDSFSRGSESNGE